MCQKRVGACQIDNLNELDWFQYEWVENHIRSQIGVGKTPRIENGRKRGQWFQSDGRASASAPSRLRKVIGLTRVVNVGFFARNGWRGSAGRSRRGVSRPVLANTTCAQRRFRRCVETGWQAPTALSSLACRAKSDEIIMINLSITRHGSRISRFSGQWQLPIVAPQPLFCLTAGVHHRKKMRVITPSFFRLPFSNEPTAQTIHLFGVKWCGCLNPE